jgi:hypothetical protein
LFFEYALYRPHFLLIHVSYLDWLLGNIFMEIHYFSNIFILAKSFEDSEVSCFAHIFQGHPK